MTPKDAFSQIDSLKTRYRFAQTTFGYDMDFTPLLGHSYRLNSAGDLEKFAIGNDLAPSISITGLHFWGRVEFFTGFSLGNIDVGASGRGGDYFRAAATGAKFFPIRLKGGKLRPFLGVALSTFSYQQGEGVKMKRVDYPILAGFTYTFKRGLLELGMNWYYDPQYEYYVQKDLKVPLNIPAFTVFADYKYFFDLSITSERMEKNGELAANLELLKTEGSLNTFSIAAGPAYSFFTGNSSHNEVEHPYLDDYQVSLVYPDVGIGYYYFNWDLTLNFSWRVMESKLSAFGVNQSVKRNSYGFEIFKFLGDYHGFVPFAGLIGSYEALNWQEDLNGRINFDHKTQRWIPGFIFGWDIRPTRSDWWGVRTNIRFFPYLKLPTSSGHAIDFQQIELNFLQMILYPNRIYTYVKRNNSKKKRTP